MLRISDLTSVNCSFDEQQFCEFRLCLDAAYWIFTIDSAETAASAAEFKLLLLINCILQCALMRNEHISSDDHVDRQFTHDAVPVPKDDSTDNS